MDKAERELAGNAFAISGSYDVGGGGIGSLAERRMVVTTKIWKYRIW